MIMTIHSQLQKPEQREQQILGLKNQMHAIKTLRGEIEEARQRTALLLKKIIYRQAERETVYHLSPEAEQQFAALSRQRAQFEILLRQSDQFLATCDRQLARCEDMLQNLAN